MANPSLPSAIYVWLVRSEEVLDQPGSWRIRKWDTEPFPEANFTLSEKGPIAAPLAQAGRADVNQATPGSPTGKAAAASTDILCEDLKHG